MMRGAAAAVLAITLLAPGSARAHTRSVSYSRWTIDGGLARVRLSLSRLDADTLQAGDAAERVATRAASHLVLDSSAGACRLVPGTSSVSSASGGEARVVVRWQARCRSIDGLRLHSRLGDLLPSHLHFARVTLEGRESPERVLGGAVEALEVFAEPSSASVLGRHVRIGVEHILSGWDHLLFLLVLLLATRQWRGAIPIVTGFTLGHSVTLGAAAMGLASPRSASVEALVALSIVLVAVENVWLVEGRGRLALPIGAVLVLLGLAALTAVLGGAGALALVGLALFAASHFGLLRSARRPERGRWAVAALFGLVHGFAFASVLGEAGLTREELPLALLGFNVGVELGQLAVVACAWPLLAWCRRRASAEHDPLVSWGSALAAGAGTFAFLTRAL